MSMKEIKRRPYRYLVDFEKVYQFMINNYAIDCSTGEKAPFFEYAQTLIDFDREHTYLFSIWEAEDEIVAFSYYELNPNQVSCSIKVGYEYLVNDVIEYAEQHMGDKEGKVIFNIYNTQRHLMDALIHNGYKKIDEKPMKLYDLRKPLEYHLPQGFRIIRHAEVDYLKLTQMIWRSFGSDRWEEKDATGAYLQQASPHHTKDLDVIIAAPNGDYACYAGMWFVPENKLAYLEPLCTMPEYRNLGLASAALSELSKKTKALGATHMTGGVNQFYTDLGFDTIASNEFWIKNTRKIE